MPTRLRIELSDPEISTLHEIAKKKGYQVGLLRRDSFLIDMSGWPADEMKHELLGYRWLEYIEPADALKLQAWIADAKAEPGISYRGITPRGLQWFSMSKISGPVLRLAIGSRPELTVPALCAALALCTFLEELANQPHSL